MRHTVAAVLLFLAAGPAAAQYGQLPPGYTPYPTPLNYLPNFYNRQSQPLSPYLNLLRGGSPGVNYYYGVRPGLPSGGATPFGTAPQYSPQVGPAAGGFLPQASIPFDPNQPAFEAGGQPVQLRSAAHPAVYGNQFAGHGGYLSVTAAAVNRTGFLPGGGGQQRPALGGLGSANPRPGTAPRQGGGARAR